jgi:hypothetical protein
MVKLARANRLHEQARRMGYIALNANIKLTIGALLGSRHATRTVQREERAPEANLGLDSISNASDRLTHLNAPLEDEAETRFGAFFVGKKLVLRCLLGAFEKIDALHVRNLVRGTHSHAAARRTGESGGALLRKHWCGRRSQMGITKPTGLLR